MSLSNLQLDKQKKIFILIVCALVIYVDSAFILKAQNLGIKSAAAKITKLKNDLTNLNRSLESMRAAKLKQGESAQKIAVRSAKIIPESQLSGLLQEISSQANKLEIKISQIRPMRELVNAKTISAGEKFIPILINLDLTCDYHTLGKFIDQLEGAEVFLSVQEIKISTQLPDYKKQKVVLVLKTYVTK